MFISISTESRRASVLRLRLSGQCVGESTCTLLQSRLCIVACFCAYRWFPPTPSVSASVRTGLGQGPGKGASRNGPRLPYDVTVYAISIERPICYLRIAWDRYLI